jgi:hypothetical protein
MNFNDGMTRKMIKLLDHTELTNTEIAERFKRRRNEPTSLSDEELACTQPTDGFLYYLRGGNDGI